MAVNHVPVICQSIRWQSYASQSGASHMNDEHISHMIVAATASCVSHMPVSCASPMSLNHAPVIRQSHVPGRQSCFDYLHQIKLRILINTHGFRSSCFTSSTGSLNCILTLRNRQWVLTRASPMSYLVSLRIWSMSCEHGRA